MENRLSDVEFYTYFSPYTAHAIRLNGVTYPTTEHAYQCLRYNDQGIIDQILAAPSPVKAWEVSSRYKDRQVQGFKDRKLEVMKALLRLKAQQHDDVRKALLESGDRRIVKHVFTYPPGDAFWDDGANGEGLNHMGKLWMEIRDELRPNHD